MGSLKSYKTSPPINMSELMVFIMDNCDTEDILNFMGRETVMQEIEISDFVAHKGDADILDYIGIKEAKDHFDLVEKD